MSRAPGLSHQIVAGNIIRIVGTYLDDRPIGIIVATIGLVFDRYSGVIPDIVFFSHDRGSEIIAQERLNAAPELVMEILSPGRQNVSRDRVAKRKLYSKHGVREYWIVDAHNRAIEVYELQGAMLEVRVIVRGDAEITSPLLPGFTSPVSRFFTR